MSTPEQWQQNNAQRLAAALAIVRSKLEHAASPAQPPPKKAAEPPPVKVPAKSPVIVTPPPAAPVSRSLFQKLLRPPTPLEVADEPVPPPPAPEPSSPPPAESAAPAAADHEPAPRADVGASELPTQLPWAMDMLGERLALSSFEQNLLLLAAAPEFDTRITSLCARAQDDPQKTYPTFALAITLFDDATWDALSPERPLRFWRLIEIHQPAGQALTASAIRADERIVSYLKGLNFLDDRLTPYFTPLELVTGAAVLSDSQREQAEMILNGWHRSTPEAPLPIVQLVGADPLSKQLVAYHVAAELGRRLYRLNAETLPATPGELELLARLWQRESRLLPLALYFDAEEAGPAEMERSGPLSRFLSRSDGIFFVGIREFTSRIGRAHQAVDVAKPNVAEQQAAWTEGLGADANDAPAQLAAQFNLNLPSIEILAALAQAQAKAGGMSLADAAWEACRISERPKLDTLAQRLEPKMSWSDLVLPKPEEDLLRQIAAQAGQRNTVYREWGFDRKMNRGFGISALFSGESGTGKTMAAEVIARELRLNLYRIDLSQVVNKYIGETEKNLRRLFDAAEDGGAILFFDEADALFGKRSEVKDSHDRYANIEVNYLLQRMESYRGLAILATNLKSSLDPAFVRRLRFIVNFQFPAVAERRRLWNNAFMQHDAEKKLPVPPLGKLDYDRLAALNLTGGHIHNVALNSAFLAAHRRTRVTMPLVLEAARSEFRKLDRPINEADFKWAEPKEAARKEEPVPA